MTGNRLLAARARDLAGRAMTERRAWLAVSVALDTTRTAGAAAAALEDMPGQAGDLARRYLTQITNGDDL